MLDLDGIKKEIGQLKDAGSMYLRDYQPVSEKLQNSTHSFDKLDTMSRFEVKNVMTATEQGPDEQQKLCF